MPHIDVYSIEVDIQLRLWMNGKMKEKFTYRSNKSFWKLCTDRIHRLETFDSHFPLSRRKIHTINDSYQSKLNDSTDFWWAPIFLLLLLLGNYCEFSFCLACNWLKVNSIIIDGFLFFFIESNEKYMQEIRWKMVNWNTSIKHKWNQSKRH